MKYTTFSTLFVISIIFFAAVSVYSSGPGSLDLSFAGAGFKYDEFGTGFDRARDTAIQPDGKIVVVGRTIAAGVPQTIGIARFNPDGSFDTTFNNGGKIVIEASINSDSYPAAAVELQPDGKIVVAGFIRINSNDEYIVLRFNTDGSPDTSFDGDGRVITPLIGSDRAGDLGIQPDGKILITGASATAPATVMIRYNPDGSLDSGFGESGNGIVSMPFYGVDQYQNQLIIQPDGRIIAGGKVAWNSGIAMVRYNADGTVDTSFGTNNIVVTTVMSDRAGPKSLALTAEGKIVGAGYIQTGPNLSDFAVFRCNSDGSFDTSFGDDGIVTAGVLGAPNSERGTALAPQPDGKIVVTGNTASVSGSKLALLRFNVDGSLDLSFDGDGRLVVPMWDDDDSCASLSIELQADGKMVAGGACRRGFEDDVTLVRLNIDGSLDGSFGSGGILFADFGPGQAFGRDVVVQSDGKIVVGGYSRGNFALVRYNANGGLDPSFGIGGKVKTFWFNDDTDLRDMFLQADGKIIAVGTMGGAWLTHIAVSRYNTDGSLDPTFGNGGKVFTERPNYTFNNGVAVAAGPDGKIAVLAYSSNPPNPTASLTISILCFNPDGTPNASFDGDGVLVPTNITANKLAIQPDGKIVVGGSSGGVFSVARFNANGTPDTTFDGDGTAITPVLTEGQTSVSSLVLLSDGRILAVGRSSSAGETDLAMVRYNADGSLDTTFDGDGKVAASIGLAAFTFNKAAIQSDGKIMVSADTNIGSSSYMALARFNPDGSLDTTYGEFGVAVVSHALTSTVPATYGLALDANDNALIAGTLNDFVVLRVTSNYSPQVAVGGRVVSTNGQPIGGATVVITDASRLTQTARTNAFGYYTFSNVSSNEVYTVRVSNKRFRFNPSTQTITVTGSLSNVDFVGNPGSELRGAVKTEENVTIKRSPTTRNLTINTNSDRSLTFSEKKQEK